MVAAIQAEVAIRESTRESHDTGGVGFDGECHELHHDFHLVGGLSGRPGFFHFGRRLRLIKPRSLQVDFLFEATHGVEILGELILILFAELLLHVLGSSENGVENAAVSLQA